MSYRYGYSAISRSSNRGSLNWLPRLGVGLQCRHALTAAGKVWEMCIVCHKMRDTLIKCDLDKTAVLSCCLSLILINIKEGFIYKTNRGWRTRPCIDARSQTNISLSAYVGPKTVNSLPIDIQRSENYSYFKANFFTFYSLKKN